MRGAAGARAARAPAAAAARGSPAAYSARPATSPARGGSPGSRPPPAMMNYSGLTRLLHLHPQALLHS